MPAVTVPMHVLRLQALLPKTRGSPIVGSASVPSDDAFALEQAKVMHHRIVRQGRGFGYPRGVQGFLFDDFKNLASRPQAAFDVSDVLQVSVGMHEVTVE